MLSALRVAECFLHIAGQQVECDITPLKLQKLLYYAEGLSLALRGQSLFSEPILAWRYGPVVRDVFKTYEYAGRNSIPCPADFDEGGISEDDMQIIETAMKFYGGFSAERLVDMTHSEYPYINTPRNDAINREIMKKFFRDKIEADIPAAIEDIAFQRTGMENMLSWL
jgi:uncharacterized phage-associated protein